MSHKVFVITFTLSESYISTELKETSAYVGPSIFVTHPLKVNQINYWSGLKWKLAQKQIKKNSDKYSLMHFVFLKVHFPPLKIKQ